MKGPGLAFRLSLLFLAGMQSISLDLYSAAEVDGAGYWQRFRYVTIPALRPILFLVLVLATMCRRRRRPEAQSHKKVR